MVQLVYALQTEGVVQGPIGRIDLHQEQFFYLQARRGLASQLLGIIRTHMAMQ